MLVSLKPKNDEICADANSDIFSFILMMEGIMGKYIIGWMLGVPVIVLVIIYILMH